MIITLIDGLHDSDRGGAGIIEGAICLLHRILPKKQTRDIALVYRTSKNTPEARTAHRHTRQRFPELQIYFSPYNKKRNSHPLLSFLQGAAAFVGGIWLLAIAPLSRNPVIKRIRKSDIIISKGGHFYHSLGASRWSPLGLISPFIGMFLLLLALRLKKPLVLLGHSIGPYPNQFSRWCARQVFLRIPHIGVREEISAQYLRDMGIPETQIYTILDTAFAIESTTNSNNLAHREHQGFPVLGLTPRPWHYPGHTEKARSPQKLYTRYIHETSRAAEQFVQAYKSSSIFLIAHNFGFHDIHEDDCLVVDAIWREMRVKENVTLIKRDLSVSQQRALYGGCDVLIGTRMHSIIFALLGGCPVVAISYTHKTRGIMEMLGLGDYVINIEDIDARELYHKASDALESSSAIISHFNNVRTIQLEHLQAFLVGVFNFHDLRFGNDLG